jgi:hypothetical protein
MPKKECILYGMIIVIAAKLKYNYLEVRRYIAIVEGSTREVPDKLGRCFLLH